MLIWVIMALMTGAAVLAVLWPLSRSSRAEAGEGEAARRFYRDQIAEIDRDEARGLVGTAEAEAARAEAGRRLLRSQAEAAREQPSPIGEPALRRRRAASALALSTVPLLAVAVYGGFGSPALPAQPLSARLEADPKQLEFADAVARVERHLTQHPEDGRGWEVIAPVYLRAGRADDAAKAYQAAIRHLGESAPRLANLGEALVVASDGVVGAEARTAFERALALDAGSVKPRYYLAQAAEQDGDLDGARTRLTELVAASPPGAPWIEPVREKLAKLGGQGAAAVASLPRENRNEAIRAMVAGLAARLETQGGTPDEWARLVRSYLVLGEREKATQAMEAARRSLGSATAEAKAPLEALARDVSAPQDKAP